jgi:hypothetical protein
MAGLKFFSFVALCWLLAAPVARAADRALGPHGGPMADTEPYNVELVLANGDIHVFAFDDKTRAPVSATTAHGTATVLIGDQKQTVELAPGPADDNLLAGHIAGAADGRVRIVVVLHFLGQPSIVARFAI